MLHPVGIVIRRDLIIDGMVFGNVAIEGSDSTQNILSMYRSLKRDAINCIMPDGLVISMYNIIDGEELGKHQCSSYSGNIQGLGRTGRCHTTPLFQWLQN